MATTLEETQDILSQIGSLNDEVKQLPSVVNTAHLPENDKATITAINTMPITIATDLSFATTVGKRWHPPQPRPKRIHPDKSGRVLVDTDNLPTV